MRMVGRACALRQTPSSIGTCTLGRENDNVAADDRNAKAAGILFDWAQQVGERATLERMLADGLIFIRTTGASPSCA